MIRDSVIGNTEDSESSILGSNPSPGAKKGPMEFYLVVQKNAINGKYAPAQVGIYPPDSVLASQRVIKINLEISDEAWEYPTVDLVWPTTPVVLPEAMRKDLTDWTDQTQPP